METWITSDTHYSHRNIIRYCSRPFDSIEQHDDELIRRFNSKVGPDDIVYHIGDFCLGDARAATNVYRRLNGREIHLIKGNHDKLRNYIGIFTSVQDVLMLKLGKEPASWLWLSHYAHARWPHAHHGALHVFGHSHGHFKGLGRSMDVGVDTNNFFPYNAKEIIKKLGHLEMVEHHRED